MALAWVNVGARLAVDQAGVVRECCGGKRARCLWSRRCYMANQVRGLLIQHEAGMKTEEDLN